MKKSFLIFAVLWLCAGMLNVRAATKAVESNAKTQAPGAQFAEAISTVTGVAISPLLGTGAYGAVMASNYNRRTMPPEVLVEGGRWRVIRRRQTIDDLLALEI